MSPSYRTTPAVTQSSGTVTSWTVTKQSGTSSGDHILMYVFGGTGTAACTGFSVNIDSNSFGAVFHRLADGTEGSSFTITGLAGNRVTSAIVTVAAASGALDPASIPTPSSGGASTSISIAGVTLGHSGDLVLWFGSNENGFSNVSYAITPPSGFTSQATNGAQSNNPCVMLADSSSLGSGATGTKTGTTGTASFYSGVLIGLPAAPGGSGLLVSSMFP